MISQSFIKKFGTIIGLIALTSLVQAAQFHLPNRTPGLQTGLVQQNINGNPVNCEHVIVPNTNCHLYFPIDGSQPTTAEAGQYSGARYNNPDNNHVTDWWVRVFGGREAVESSYFIPHVDTEKDVHMVAKFLGVLNIDSTHNLL